MLSQGLFPLSSASSRRCPSCHPSSALLPEGLGGEEREGALRHWGWQGMGRGLARTPSRGGTLCICEDECQGQGMWLGQSSQHGGSRRAWGPLRRWDES